MPILDPTFNNVVIALSTSRILRTETQFPDFAAMKADFLSTGWLRVNVNFCENTIFGDPSVNVQFRAWHDLCHIELDADFSPEGERAAAALQIAQVYAVYGNNADTRTYAAIIDAEVNGQLAYYLETGAFPENQYEFVCDYLRSKYGFSKFPLVSIPLGAGETCYSRAAMAARLTPSPIVDPYARPIVTGALALA